MLAFLLDLLLWDRRDERFNQTRPKRGETDRDYARRLRKMHWKFLDGEEIQ